MKKLLLTLFLLITYAYSFNITQNQSCYCNSCVDCSDALNSVACKEVYLSSPLIADNSSCITIIAETSNKAFDCNSFEIFSYYENNTAIISNGNNIEIRNCIIRDFPSAIRVANNFSLKNIELYNNEEGISINLGYKCSLYNITIDTSERAVGIKDTDSCSFSNLYITKSRFGLDFYSSKFSEVINSFFEATRYPVMTRENSIGIKIRNNNFTLSIEAIHIRGFEMNISSNNFINNEKALVIYGNRHYFSGNYFDRTKLIFNQTESLHFVSNNLNSPDVIFEDSNGGIIYNNIFNSTVFFLKNSSNRWNTSFKKETNIIGYNALGGNYWTNARKTGFSDICEDKDNDAICDEAKMLDKRNKDELPLTFPRDSKPPLVYFDYPTPEDGTILYDDNFEVLVKGEDDKKLSVIEVVLYREGNVYSSEVCRINRKTGICNITFSLLTVGDYMLNATASDIYKNVNYTETRTIIIKGYQSSFSYEMLWDYLPVAVIASLIVVMIKEVLDISVLFLKGVKK